MTNPTGPYGGNQPPQNPYGTPQQPPNPYAAQPPNPYGQPQQGAPAGYPPQNQQYGAPQNQQYGAPQNQYGAPQGGVQDAVPPNPYAGGVGAPPNPYGAQQPQNPYGQPQPPNNPYGQQPQNPYGQQPFGQAPQNPYGSGAKPKGGFLKNAGGVTAKIRIIVAVVVIVGGGIAWLVSHGKDPASAKAGDCVHITGEDANSAKKVACTDATANYTVIERYTGTSDTTKCEQFGTAHPNEVALYQTGKDKFVLCLDPKS